MEHPSNPVRKEMGKVSVIPAGYTPTGQGSREESLRTIRSVCGFCSVGYPRFSGEGTLEPLQESISVTSRFPKNFPTLGE